VKHVIIGAGAAGITAAKTIRGLCPEDEIVIISEDEQISSRCMLHKYISGERDNETISFVPGDFFTENKIKWYSGVKVTGVDTAAKKVLTADEAVNYDKLLIATGSMSITPPIGALQTAKNVFGLRVMTDAKAIRERAKKAKQIVIVGAGLVGLDAAYALLEMKKDVTVVELIPRILSINIDAQAAGAYQKLFEEAGCKFHLGRKVTDTVVDSEGNVSQVLLDDGTALSCDLVVVAVGVRPASAFLEGSDIARNNMAIIVDKYMATNNPDVYVAGDVAGLSGIWPNAMRQGYIAASNMCGDSKTYDDTFAIKNTVNFFGLVTLSVGMLDPADGDSVVMREDRNSYQKVIIRDGCIKGVILQGDISNGGFWQYLIKNSIKIDAIKKPVWKISYADFCTLDESGEYRWTVAG